MYWNATVPQRELGYCIAMKDVPWRNLVELKLCLINFDSVTFCKLEFEQKVLKNLYIDLFCLWGLSKMDDILQTT